MKHPILTAVLLLMVGFTTADDLRAEWDFRDLYLAIGLSEMYRDVRLPKEVQGWLIDARRPTLAGYVHNATKASLLIDVRLDLRFHQQYRFVPNFHFWNWGDFPDGETGTETSIRGFGVNTDLHRLFRTEQTWQPYIGAGVGMVVLNTLTRFADDFWTGAPLRILRLSEQKLAMGANVALGVELPIRDNRSRVFSEIRYETTVGLQQIKFLVGISTF